MLKKLFCCVASPPSEEALQKRRPSSMWGNTARAESVEMAPIASPPAAASARPAPRLDKGKGRATERRVPPVPQPIDVPPPVRKLGPMAGIYYDYEPYSVLTQKVAPVRGRRMDKPSPLKPLLLPIIVDARARQAGGSPNRATSHARMPSIEEVLFSSESTTQLVPPMPSRRIPIHRAGPRPPARPLQDMPRDVTDDELPPPRRARLAEMPAARPESSTLPYLSAEPSPPHSARTSTTGSGCTQATTSSPSSSSRRPISLLWDNLSETAPSSPATSRGDSFADDEASASGEAMAVVYGEAY